MMGSKSAWAERSVPGGPLGSPLLMQARSPSARESQLSGGTKPSLSVDQVDYVFVAPRGKRSKWLQVRVPWALLCRASQMSSPSLPP